MKKVLIPFSGGLDSTYLVWKNLKEGNDVTIVYFEIENNAEKVKLEKIHRAKIITLFQKEFGHGSLHIPHLEYKILASGIINNYSLIQVPIWMLGAFMGSNHTYDEIQMGYVMNDDALSYLDEIRTLFNAYQPFSNDPLPKITFPIIRKHKTEMLRELPEIYLKYVYSCENPNITKDNKEEIEYHYCGQCVPCQKYKEKLEHQDYYFPFSSECTRKVVKNSGEFSFRSGVIDRWSRNALELGEKFDLEKLSLNDAYRNSSPNRFTLKERDAEIPVRLLKVILNKTYVPTEEEQKEIDNITNHYLDVSPSYKTKAKPVNQQLCLFTPEELHDLCSEGISDEMEMCSGDEEVLFDDRDAEAYSIKVGS